MAAWAVAPRAVAAWAVAAGLVLAGCGASERSQVQSKVEQFARAAAGHDYKTICDQVLAPGLLARLAAGGIPCEQAMQIGLRRVQSPTINIGRVTISGENASVITLSGARGQLSSLQSIQLVKTSNGWRINSLGSPVAK